MKRTKARHGDRIVNTVTGEVGTIIDVHDDVKPVGSPDNYSVLRDTGTRATVVWCGADVEIRFEVVNMCHRCRERDHTAVSCPNGDIGSVQARSMRAAA